MILCLVAGAARATVFLPPICVDKYDKVIDCPAYDARPAQMSDASKRDFLRHLEDVLHGEYITNLRNDRYRALFQPRWTSGTNGEEGYCVVEVHQFDLENYALRDVREYHQVRMNEEECSQEFDRLKTSKGFEPFEARKNERLVCDDPTPSRCDGAAHLFGYLAKRGVSELVSDANITIIGRAAQSDAGRRRFWTRFVDKFAYHPAQHILTDEKYLGSFLGGIACAKSSGWMICYEQYSNGIDPKYVVFGDTPPAY